MFGHRVTKVYLLPGRENISTLRDDGKRGRLARLLRPERQCEQAATEQQKEETKQVALIIHTFSSSDSLKWFASRGYQSSLLSGVSGQLCMQGGCLR
jgi:hypothetical protein